MRRLPNNQMEFNIGLGVKAHSLDVVADIIGTMRMQKIIEITENVQPNEKERIEQLDKELHILGKSSVSCPLKPSDSAPLKHSTMPP